MLHYSDGVNNIIEHVFRVKGNACAALYTRTVLVPSVVVLSAIEQDGFGIL